MVLWEKGCITRKCLLALLLQSPGSKPEDLADVRGSTLRPLSKYNSMFSLSTYSSSVWSLWLDSAESVEVANLCDSCELKAEFQ